MNYFKYILRNRYIFKVSAIIFLTLTIIYTITVKKSSTYDISDTSFRGIVYKIKKSSNKTTIYIKGKEKLVINYYDELEESIGLGDEILATGNLKVPSNNTIPNQFNYRKYLYYNRIYYTLTAKEISKVANNTNIIYYIKDKIAKRISKIIIFNF